MSQQPNQEFVTTQGAPAIEPLASILEYADRLGSRHLWTLRQLEKLREHPEHWIVAGPTRIESWHVGAVAIGPPGLFLIWPVTTGVEPGLWATLQECREHVQRCLSEQSQVAVEVVIFSPSHDRGHMQRWMNTEFDVLTADGHDLDRLLAEWEPVSGRSLSEHWLSKLEAAAEPRETLYGPDKGAHQQFPLWSAARATIPADRPDE
jgi:hypothetical protein